jgi:hypothetical protein
MTGPLLFTPEYYRRMRQLESDGWCALGAGIRLPMGRTILALGQA